MNHSSHSTSQGTYIEFIVFVIAGFALAVVQLFFQRNAAKKILDDGRLSGAGWSLLFALISVAMIVVTGWNIVSSVQ